MSVSDQIEADSRTLDEMIAELNREALKHRNARDNYQQQARVLAEKRDSLHDKARKVVVELQLMRQRRDDFNNSAREAKEKREEWNDKFILMRERRNMEEADMAKDEANKYHQKVMKNSHNGQIAHEKMMQLSKEADTIRAEAESYHEKFLDCRKAADLEHVRYIETIQKIEELKDNLPD